MSMTSSLSIRQSAILRCVGTSARQLTGTFKNRAIILRLLLGIAVVYAIAERAAADPAPPVPCEALGKADFSNLADAPTQIGVVKLVESVDDLLNGVIQTVSDQQILSQIKKNLSSIQPYCRVHWLPSHPT